MATESSEIYEEASSEAWTDEYIDFVCSFCKKSGKLKPAIKYCVECEEKYCQICINNQHNFPSQHKLLGEIEYVTYGRRSNLPSASSDIRCEAHNAMFQDMFCKDHDDIGCTTCMDQQHRSCLTVLSVGEAVEIVKLAVNPKAVRENLLALKTKLVDVKERKEKELTELHMSRKSALTAIKSFCKELLTIVAQLEESSIQELDADYSAKETRVKRDLQDAINNHGKIEQAIKRFDITSGSNTMKFINIKYAEKVEKSLNQINQTYSMPNKICYDLNLDVIKFLQELTSFAQKKSPLKQGETLHLLIDTRSPVYRGKQVAKINVKTSRERPCSILGSCFTEDDYLLLSDHYNRKILRVDVSGQCIRNYCDVPAKPFGVCSIELKQAAVCLDNKTVQFVILGENMKLSKQLMFDHNCYDVVYNNGEIFITDHDKSVYVYDMTGYPLRKLTCNIDKRNGNLTFDSFSDRLYITAIDCLLSCDRFGNKVSKFSDPDIHGIKGVCTDGKGSVFVCGQVSCNVVQLGPDNTIICETIENLRTYGEPRTVCFNLRNYKMCLYFGKHSIKVFDLQEAVFV